MQHVWIKHISQIYSNKNIENVYDKNIIENKYENHSNVKMFQIHGKYVKLNRQKENNNF